MTQLQLRAAAIPLLAVKLPQHVLVTRHHHCLSVYLPTPSLAAHCPRLPCPCPSLPVPSFYPPPPSRVALW
jgi:hypothetical protein